MFSIFTRIFKPVYDTNGQPGLPVWKIRAVAFSVIFMADLEPGT